MRDVFLSGTSALEVAMARSYHQPPRKLGRMEREAWTIALDTDLGFIAAEFRFHHYRHLLLVTPGMSPASLARALDAQHVIFFVTLHGQPYCDRSLTHHFRTIWIEDVGYDARRYFDLIEAVLRKYGGPLLKTPGSFIHVRRSMIERLG
jgi:hypothetical protein